MNRYCVYIIVAVALLFAGVIGYLVFAPGAHVTVRNTGREALRDVKLYVTGRAYSLGDLAPGSVRTHQVSPLYEANWLRMGGQPGILLVGWDTGVPDEREWLLARLAGLDVAWHRHRPRMEVASGVLLLQHAAGPGAEVRLAPADQAACIGQVVPVGIAPGRYALESLALDEEAGGERYCCVVCRWVPTR
jgi:hypothetical protein